MRDQYWSDTPEAPDRKRRRQAEFLVHRMFPTALITGIAVKNGGIKEQVLEILQGEGVEVPVQIKPSWYY